MLWFYRLGIEQAACVDKHQTHLANEFSLNPKRPLKRSHRHTNKSFANLRFLLVVLGDIKNFIIILLKKHETVLTFEYFHGSRFTLGFCRE